MEKLKLADLEKLKSDKIIAILEGYPAEQMNYEFTCLLAKAYNNEDLEPLAKQLLLSVQEQGENDPLWNYRLGYSCFYLNEYDEALAYLERAKTLGCKWANELLPQCREFVNAPSPTVDLELVDQVVAYLNCECQLYYPLQDDDMIMDAYQKACIEGRSEGFVPMLLSANDETLLECFLMNVANEDDPIDSLAVKNFREKMLNMPMLDGQEVLQAMIEDRKVEAADDEMIWESEIIGECRGGCAQNRYLALWDYGTRYTYPIILAKIPVKNPWEVFAYLPFGAWNECPDIAELMACTKLWYEKYGAIPVMMTYDQLEFRLDKPISSEEATAVALQHYGFCPDVIEQAGDEGGVGRLADQLSKSKVWSFWWD